MTPKLLKQIARRTPKIITASHQIIFPFWGEFGYFILSYVPQIYKIKCEKLIVCCLKGHECLFPTAHAFYHDYKNPIPDKWRSGLDADWKPSLWHKEYILLRDKLNCLYPEYTVRKLKYNPWLKVNFKPLVSHQLCCDICLSPRLREWCVNRNWGEWDRLIEDLHRLGYKIGIAGKQETTKVCNGDVFAWEHSDGELAGTIDLLQNCRLYASADTGVSFLAALMETKSLIWKIDGGMLAYIRRNNPNYFEIANKYSLIIDTIERII